MLEASVVVPLACDRARALACLEALAAQADAPHHEVILVHDGSPELVELLSDVGGDVVMVAATPWPGTDAALALGRERALAQRILEVQDVEVLRPGWLTAQLSPSAPGPQPLAPGTPPELTIVIPTLDVTSPRVQATLRAVKAATDAAHVIVLVDNGRPAQGFTGPVNIGVRGAETPYVVVMNDDVHPLPGWWPPLRAALDQGAALVFPTTIDGVMRHDFAAWCFAMSIATVAGFGHSPDDFFDPALVVWYQDTDLLLRLRDAGRPPREVPASRIRHGLSQTVNDPDPQLHAWVRRQVEADRRAFCAKHPAGAPAAAPAR